MPNANDPHPSSPSPDKRSHDSPESRVLRLEEHAAFTEHTVEQLSTEIAEVNRRIIDLAKRLGGLEARLSKTIESLSGSDATANDDAP